MRCSSASSNQAALRQAGKELKYEWGCGQTWDVCAVMEGTAETLAANAVIAGARVWQAFQFNTSSLLWSAAIDQWSFWVWAVWIVVILVGIVAITKAAFSGSPGEVIAAIVRTGLAFPLTQATLWFTGRVVDAVDSLIDNEDLDDEQWRSVSAHLDDRELIELVILVGHYRMLATAIEVLRIQPDGARG